jgi:response regulator of citrate/malate metabolism
MDPQTLRKVLIIEDDLSQKPIWNHIISKISRSIEVEWVVSSEKAKKLIESSMQQATHFDLIIVDLFLAGSDTGLDFLRSKEVRALGVKTILVSAANKELLESHMSLEPGNTKVIIKPLNADKCIRALNEILQ